MRIFVAFEDVRLPMDVQPGQTVGDVKAVLKDHFKLNSSHAEDKILQMTYAGAVLHNEWICSDVGITSGSTIKSALKDSDQPVLLINCCYNGEIIAIRQQLDVSKTPLAQLRRIVSVKSGLPVSVFRLCTKDGREMFDCHNLEKYGVVFGDTINLHVWDGWVDLLRAATQGHTRKVLRNAFADDQIAKFQFRVACYIAAHFGYVDLANSMIHPKLGGVKPEEPVGQHPLRLWSKDSTHVDAWKTPIHEAAECGKINVIRIFVQNNICCLVAKDGNERLPIQTGFRNKQVECVQYLSTKLYSSHTENNVTLPVLIVIKTRKWCERARNTVLSKHGAYRSSMRRRPYNAPALVGHGVDINGYGESHLNSRSKIPGASFCGIDGVVSQFPGVHGKDKRAIMKLNRNGNFDSAKELHTGREKMYSESSVATGRGDKLPGIRHSNYVSRGTGETTPTGDLDSGSYIQTPKQEKQKLPAINEGAKPMRDDRRKFLIDGAIPLPAVSVENTLRPFFHVSSKLDNPVLITLKLFEKYRQMDSRENAIHCMTVSSTFKDKAWLRQVDLAVSLARRGVLNSIYRVSNRSLNTRSLPTVVASPLKTR